MWTSARFVCASGLLVTAVWPATAGTGQIAQSPSVPQTMPGVPAGNRPGLPPDPMDGPGPLGASNAARLQHLREDDRHKRLLADTARLLALSNELKADVEKTSKDELSVDVVRKAAEIEKLAHDVKERMRS